jgi:hypothetical protein
MLTETKGEEDNDGGEERGELPGGNGEVRLVDLVYFDVGDLVEAWVCVCGCVDVLER